MEKDNYLKSLQSNKNYFEEYYLRSFAKSEQQKFLEQLLTKENSASIQNIADIASGAGSLSYHLNKMYPNASFYLADYNKDAIELAKQKLDFPNFNFFIEDIYELNSIPQNYFDLVFCWQTLSWLEEPEKVLNKLLSITKPGGKIYISSLFNIQHDVDIYSRVSDYSNASDGKIIQANYNTYSKYSVAKWIQGKAKTFELLPFHTPIDFLYSGRGIGTYTINTEKERLQVSAGLLLNWAVLVIEK